MPERERHQEQPQQATPEITAENRVALQYRCDYLIARGLSDGIEILRETRPDFTPEIRPDLVQQGYREILKAGISSDAVRLLKRFTEATGIPPNEEVVKRAYESAGEGYIASQVELIRDLHRETGVAIPGDMVGLLYWKAVNACEPDSVRVIRDLTGRDPDLREVHGAYERIISGSAPDTAKQLTPLQEATGVPLDAEAARNVCLVALRNIEKPVGLAQMITTLAEECGVAFDAAWAASAYDLALNGDIRADVCDAIKKVTDVSLSREQINAAYQRQLKASLPPVSQIETIKRISGEPIPEDIAVEYLIRTICEFGGGNLEAVKDRLEISLTPAAVERVYREVYHRGITGHLGAFPPIHKTLGLLPSDDLMRRIAVHYLEGMGGFMALGALRSLYGDRFPELLPRERVQQKYAEFMNKEFWTGMKDLEKATGIKYEISERRGQQVFDGLVGTGKLREATQFMKATGRQYDISQNTVNSAYASLVRGLHVEQIVVLRDLAPGKEPDPAVIQEAYRGLFSTPNIVNEIRSIELMVGAIGIKPDESVAMAAYKASRDFLLGVKFIERVYGLTHIEPDPEFLEQWQVAMVRGGDTTALDRLYKLFKHRASPELIQQALGEYCAGTATYLPALQHLIDKTGVKPSSNTILTLYGTLLRERIADFCFAIAAYRDIASPTPEMVSEGYLRLMKTGDLHLLDLLQQTGMPFEVTEANRKAIDELLLRNADARAPRKYVSIFSALKTIWPKDEPLPEHPSPWTEMYVRLTKLQAPAEREEFDPWAQELEPLLDDLFRRQPIQEDVEPDAIYDFVREFGMYNLPTIARWYIAVRRARTIADIPRETVMDIEVALTIRLHSLPNPGAVVVEIKKFRQRIQEELLADRVPEAVLSTQAGMELFNALKGTTRWGGGDKPEDLIAQWRLVSDQHPERARLPEGYEATTIAVARATERRELSRDDQQRIEDIVQNPDVQTALERMHAAFWATRQENPSISEWCAAAQVGVLQLLDHEIVALEMALVVEKNEKKKRGIEKKLTDWKEKRDGMSAARFPELPDPPNEIDIATFLEDLVYRLPQKMPGRDDLLRGLSAYHASLVMPNEWRDNIQLYAGYPKGFEDVWNKGDIKVWADVLVQYLNEHYLHPDQEDHDRTRHHPFGEELLRALRGAWGLRGGLKENPLVQAAEKIREIERGGDVHASGKKVEVTLVPAKGILRIFGGDIGDACYTSQHDRLARGEFPGITAFTYVTGRGTTNERLRGSFLIVETTTPTGEKVLVLRANNPQENLLAQVDADDLMEKTIGAMIDLAKRRGIDYVMIPGGGAGGAASNRNAVISNYARRFETGGTKYALVSTPDTNFNGYAIWRIDGQYPARLVWRKNV